MLAELMPVYSPSQHLVQSQERIPSSLLSSPLLSSPLLTKHDISPPAVPILDPELTNRGRIRQERRSNTIIGRTEMDRVVRIHGRFGVRAGCAGYRVGRVGEVTSTRARVECARVGTDVGAVVGTAVDEHFGSVAACAALAKEEGRRIERVRVRRKHECEKPHERGQAVDEEGHACVGSWEGRLGAIV